MIERFYLKNHLSFDEVDLRFDKNLIVFSGPSGAGKSILMEALLTLFGLKECDAQVIEATIDGHLDLKSVGIEEDDPNIFTCNKEKAARYFINKQQISKKNIKTLSSHFVNYLSLRDFKEFENDRLLTLLDAIVSKTSSHHDKELKRFKQHYHDRAQSLKALKSVEEEEDKVTQLKEFALFEIAQIEDINPDIDEYETLLIQKKELSKKEKIEHALSTAMEIFNLEQSVYDTLSLLELPTESFADTMNELKITLENADERLHALDGLDIEQMLDRLEKLSSLKTKYGSIEESLSHLKTQKEALARYDNIAFEKKSLEEAVAKHTLAVKESASKLSKARQKALKTLQERITYYLNLLYLDDLQLQMTQAQVHALGQDHVALTLKETSLQKVSSGELNRVRLATLAASSEFIQSTGGLLILDEIDANLSGKESMSIAKVLQVLATQYQIFAISHQPQLSSKADIHFLVYKEAGKSRIKKLNKKERIDELSRMISGEKITKEAKQFATSLLS